MSFGVCGSAGGLLLQSLDGFVDVTCGEEILGGECGSGLVQQAEHSQASCQETVRLHEDECEPSFAPSGLHVMLLTHGLRRGLHSYAASRLKRTSRGGNRFIHSWAPQEQEAPPRVTALS